MRVAALAAFVIFTSASNAGAVSCRTWERLNPAQKSQTIDGLIHRAVSSSTARQYELSPGRMTRCLEGYANSIYYDFEDACAEGARAGMQALDHLFKRYVWSCVQ